MSHTPKKTKARFAPYQRSPSPGPSHFPKTPRKEDGLPFSHRSPAYARFKRLPPASPSLRTIVEETARAAQSSELPLEIEDAIFMSELEKLNINKFRSDKRVAEANRAEAVRQKNEEDKKTRTPHKRDRARKTPGKRAATEELASATHKASGANCASDLQPSPFPRPPSPHFPSQRPPSPECSPTKQRAVHSMAIRRAEEEARRARLHSQQKAEQAREEAQREEQRVLAEENAAREAQAAEDAARQEQARALANQEAEAAAAKAREAAREEQARLQAEWEAAEREREEVRQEQARALAERQSAQAAEIRALQAERARVAQAQAMEEERIRLQREAERLAAEYKALEEAKRQAAFREAEARLLAEAEEFRRLQDERDRLWQQQEETFSARTARCEEVRRNYMSFEAQLNLLKHFAAHTESHLADFYQQLAALRAEQELVNARQREEKEREQREQYEREQERIWEQRIWEEQHQEEQRRQWEQRIWEEQRQEEQRRQWEQQQHQSTGTRDVPMRDPSFHVPRDVPMRDPSFHQEMPPAQWTPTQYYDNWLEQWETIRARPQVEPARAPETVPSSETNTDMLPIDACSNEPHSVLACEIPWPVPMDIHPVLSIHEITDAQIKEFMEHPERPRDLTYKKIIGFYHPDKFQTFVTNKLPESHKTAVAKRANRFTVLLIKLMNADSS